MSVYGYHKLRFHLVIVHEDVEPEITGSFATEDERDQAARDHKRWRGDEDGIFWLDEREGRTPLMGAYSHLFFDPDHAED